MTHKTRGDLVFNLAFAVLVGGFIVMDVHGFTKAEILALILWATGFGVLLILAARYFNKARQEEAKASKESES